MDNMTQIIINEIYAVLGAFLQPTIKCSLDGDAALPVRAHDTDGGADLRTPVAVTVPAHGSAVVHTGVHIQLPQHTCGLLVSKSGLMVFNALTSTGLIDQGYTDEIHIRVFNDGDEDYHFAAGEMVSQVVVLPVLYPTYVQVERIEGGERGDNGLGSTGR